MIIAVDGPAGAGKSTVCRILAKKLGFVYLDTGAMYRAVAWALKADPCRCENGTPDDDGLAFLLERLPLHFSVDGDRLLIFYGERLLTGELRSPGISDDASRVSRMSAVRRFMVDRQRELAGRRDVVAEGRDTATVVFPDADLKVYLTADLQARAERRFEEYRQKGMNVSLEEIRERIRARDEADENREHSPLRPAEGSVFVDTSNLGIEQVVDLLIEMAGSLKQNASCNEPLL